MKIKTVTFSQSIETVYGYGLKKWTKAASEIEFDEEKDNPDHAYDLAKQLVKEQIAKELAEHTEQMGTQVRSIEQEDSVPLADQINSCKELKVLESYKLIVRNDEVLNAAYRKKLVELSNQ